MQADRIEKLKEFLAASPDDAFVQHALGLEYIKLGKDVEARKLFERIIETQSDYIGTYYHLAKLLERVGENDSAIKIYELGMGKAKQVGDQHAFGELKGAYEELIF